MSHANDVKDMYPDPRKVLRGNGHVANLRCAVKYTAWQGLYLLGALVLGIVGGAKWVFYGLIAPFGRVSYDHVLEPIGVRVANVLRRYGIGVMIVYALDRFEEWLLNKLHATKLYTIAFGRVTKNTLIRFAEWLVQSRVSVLGLALAAPIAFVLLVGEEINRRTGIFTGIFNVIIFVLESSGHFAVGAGKQVGACSKEGAERFSRGISEKAEEMQQRPGTRRIYGMCPVTFDQKPRWFENVFSEDDDESAPGSEDNPWSEEDIDDFMDDVDDTNHTLVTDGGRPYVISGPGWNMGCWDNSSSGNTSSNSKW